MIRKFFQIITISAICLIVSFQEANSSPYIRPRNNIHLNLFGDASLFSLSYDRILVNYDKFFLSGKFGVGYSESMKLPSKNTALLSIPLHITGNVKVSERKQFIEFGFGGTLLFYEDMKFWDYSIYPLVGYRLQPYKKAKISLRIFISYPVTEKIDFDKYWFSPVGFSIGYCF